MRRRNHPAEGWVGKGEEEGKESTEGINPKLWTLGLSEAGISAAWTSKAPSCKAQLRRMKSTSKVDARVNSNCLRFIIEGKSGPSPILSPSLSVFQALASICCQP